jgi:hypothetical protein
MDKYVRIKSDEITYVGSDFVTDNPFYEFVLDSDRSVIFVLKSNSAAEFTSIGGTIRGLSGKTVTLWMSTDEGYFEKDLNDGSALPTDNFSYSIKVPKNVGKSTMGIRPTATKSLFTAAGTTTAANLFDWMPPRAKEVEIRDTPIAGIDFSVSVPNVEFTVSVRDTFGHAIPHAHVYAYSPNGDSMGVYGNTDHYGSVVFMVKAGTYAYGAYVDGLPPPPESTITIGATASGTLIIALPDTIIEGMVRKNREGPIPNADIYAFESSKNLYRKATTDEG